MKESPLVAFTLAMQTAVGTSLMGALLHPFWVRQAGSAAAQAAYTSTLLPLLAFAGLGLFASLGHLGSPHRAVHALRNFRQSWLSREILFAVLFSAGLVVSLLVAVLLPENGGLNRLAAWLTSAFGLALVYSMARLYGLRTMPGWPRQATLVRFFCATALLGGLYLGALAAVSPLTDLEGGGQALRLSLRLPAALALLAMAVQYLALPGRLSAEESVLPVAAKAVPAISSARLRAGLALGSVLWLNILLAIPLILWSSKPFAALVCVLAFVLALAAEALERVEFYSVPAGREL